MPDELNPSYLFQSTRTELLTAIVSGSIDPLALAKRELAARGLDSKGRWVGFANAQELQGVTL